MKRGILVVAVALVVGAVVWWWTSSRREAPGVAASARVDARAATAVAGGGATATSDDVQRHGPRAATPEARARVDALRQKIVQRVGPRGGAAAPAAAAAGAAPGERPPGNLVDRTGGGEKRREMLARLNNVFMPLADECIEQAQERTPALAGMLAIGLEIVADADLGAVVERADPAERNEVADPELLECIRESALSLTLPAPDDSGRDALLLTLPISPR